MIFCISEAYTIFIPWLLASNGPWWQPFLQQQTLISLLIRGIVTERSSQQLPYKRGLLLDLTSIYLWYTRERERERERERKRERERERLRLSWCRETFIQSGSYPRFIMHRVCCSGVWKGATSKMMLKDFHLCMWELNRRYMQTKQHMWIIQVLIFTGAYSLKKTLIKRKISCTA